MTTEKRIRQHLEFLYGKTKAKKIWSELKTNLAEFKSRNPFLQDDPANDHSRFSEQDAILITYGDQIQEPGCPPLQTLAGFLETYLGEAINGVHILPFFPYSSDDGFSVIDYRAVDPQLGSWSDINRLNQNFRLMVDAVINHVSRESEWFKAFQNGEEPYWDYFIRVDPGTDLSKVVRPRAFPLLTAVETTQGTEHVWTTFSEDQIDLNYANPEVLLEMIDLLLFYVERGAEIIRLDAIAYLWKEIGTTSIHLPQTHHVAKLIRAVLDDVAPGVILITETNVPHEENISYFGDLLPDEKGTDEAQMVYQFTLAPLVLHAFLTGSAEILNQWASSLETPSPATTFFNFIASHDGVGIRPAEGILDGSEFQGLVDRTLANGGKVSNKTNPDGSESVYELNITLYDFLNNPQAPQPEVDAARFLASQAIMLSLAGVPGIYVHSLFGSRNCYHCLEDSGRARSINRHKFQLESLIAALANPSSHHAQVFTGYVNLLRERHQHPAFHPQSEQRVLSLNDALFTVVRKAPQEAETILCLVDVSGSPQEINLAPSQWDLPEYHQWKDLISGRIYELEGGEMALQMEAYQYMWLAGE